MDSESIKLQFAKLSSTNYRSWSTTIKLVLASKDLVRYIKTSLDNLIDEKTWELTPMSSTSVLSAEAKKAIDTTADLLRLGNAKAMALIAVQVGPEQLSFIANAKTAFEQ